MFNSHVDVQTNNSEYRRKRVLDNAKLFTKIKNKNIERKMLALKNVAKLNVSGQDCNGSNNSLTSNLYIDINSSYPEKHVIKKENVSPEKNSNVEHPEIVICPVQNIKREIISPNLKREPLFVNNCEENCNDFAKNTNVNDDSRKSTVCINHVKTDSNNDVVSNKTETSKKSSNFFVSEEVNEELYDYVKKDYDVDGQLDSFSEEMSCDEKEVNSSDIEEMFSEERIGNGISGGNERSLECSTCGKHFKSERNLQKHALSHLNNGSEIVRKFECEICSKKFKKKHHLMRHNLSHENKKKFTCSHCEKCYFDKRDLQKHLSSNHTLMKCSVCEMAFDNYAKLKKHQSVHKNSEAVYCHICQKSFLKRKYLKRHLQVHAKFTPFACNQCEKSFLSQFLLTEHSRTHTGEKPFQCDKCGKKFSTKSNLVRHSRTHFRMRACKNCGNEFENEEQYKAHKLSCILNYECGKCGFIFTRINNLRRHLKTHSNSRPNGEGSIESKSDSENIIVRIAS